VAKRGITAAELMHEYMLGRAEDYADARKVAAINPPRLEAVRSSRPLV
jgi:hypothetical protein